MNRRMALVCIVIAFGLLTAITQAILSATAAPQTNSTLYLPLIQSQPLPTLAPGPTLGGCPMFPSNNVWNTRIDTLPVDPKSTTYIATIGATRAFHPDFGANWNGGPFGIPYTTAPSSQAAVPITFLYSGESDPSPYPIPPNAPVENGSDRHVLVLQQGTCLLYELYNASTSNGGASWSADSGAKFDLNSNSLRPAGWTSADAAGLPMLPGLVRYDEVAAGAINHAIRFTIRGTNGAYLWPARHRTTSPLNANMPPMGQRFRLKASFNLSGLAPQIQVIFTAFKHYGIIVADNGSDWYVSGAPDARWDDSMLVNAFNQIHGSDFEAVDETSLMVNSDSGQTQPP